MEIITIEETLRTKTVHNEKPIQTVQIESKPAIQTKQIEVPNEKQKPSAALQLFTFIKVKELQIAKWLEILLLMNLNFQRKYRWINNTLSDLPELEKTIVKVH